MNARLDVLYCNTTIQKMIQAIAIELAKSDFTDWNSAIGSVLSNSTYITLIKTYRITADDMHHMTRHFLLQLTYDEEIALFGRAIC